jgi:hypothetical protein
MERDTELKRLGRYLGVVVVFEDPIPPTTAATK